MIDIDKLNFRDAIEVLKPTKCVEEIEEDARWLLSDINIDFVVNFDMNHEAGIIFYVAGYIARTESKALKCESCTCLFVKSKDTPEIHLDDDLGDKKEKFLEQINRGGLFTPSDSLYVCVLYGRELFKKVYDHGRIEKHFLNAENQREVFTAMLEMKMKNDAESSAILTQKCADSHMFSARIKSIGARIFNTFSKNFVGELNDKIHKDRKRMPKEKKNDSTKDSGAKKIRKLQSE